MKQTEKSLFLRRNGGTKNKYERKIRDKADETDDQQTLFEIENKSQMG